MKRWLSEEERQRIVLWQRQIAIAQYPGSLAGIFVEPETDQNGIPKVKILLAGQTWWTDRGLCLGII
jgi:hypothetical protein